MDYEDMMDLPDDVRNAILKALGGDSNEDYDSQWESF